MIEINILWLEEPKIVFLILSFIGYFSQNVMDYVEIYAGNWEKIIKQFTISTIFKGPHYFY